jgi:hypothetical protein
MRIPARSTISQPHRTSPTSTETALAAMSGITSAPAIGTLVSVAGWPTTVGSGMHTRKARHALDHAIADNRQRFPRPVPAAGRRQLVVARPQLTSPACRQQAPLVGPVHKRPHLARKRLAKAGEVSKHVVRIGSMGLVCVLQRAVEADRRGVHVEPFRDGERPCGRRSGLRLDRHFRRPELLHQTNAARLEDRHAGGGAFNVKTRVHGLPPTRTPKTAIRAAASAASGHRS